MRSFVNTMEKRQYFIEFGDLSNVKGAKVFILTNLSKKKKLKFYEEHFKLVTKAMSHNNSNILIAVSSSDEEVKFTYIIISL